MHKLIYVMLAAIWVAGSTSEANAKWLVAKSPHFTIYSEEDSGSLRKRVHELEVFHKTLLVLTGTKDGNKAYPVRIYVTRDIDDMDKIVGRDVAGFYRVTQGEPVAIIPRKTFADSYKFTGDLVLRHEYAHHFMFQYFPAAYPGWYEEGWAELVSTFQIEEEGTVLFGLAADHRAYGFDTVKWIPSRMLLTTERGEMADHRYDNYYAQSWVMTHFLTMSPEWQGKLNDYLTKINNGESFEKAAEAFDTDFGDLDKAAMQYVKERKFPYRRLSGINFPNSEIEITTVPADEAEMMEENMNFIVPVSDARGKYYVDRLRKTAEKSQSGAAALLLAKAAHRHEDFAQTVTAAEDLLKFEPDNNRAYYWKGMGLMGQANTAKNDQKASLIEAARKAIQQANRMAPEDPLPLRAFYETYKVADEEVPNVVEQALWQAHLSIPQDDHTRRLLIEHLVDNGDTERAIGLLKPLVYAAHRPKTRLWAKKLYKRLKTEY